MVAFECGYQSHEAFSRAFHRWTGLSPIEFRARGQQGEAVTLPEASSFPRPGTGVSPPRVETWQGCWIAYLRHVGSYQLLDEVYGRVFAIAGAAGMSWPLQLLGIAYDDPDLTPADQLRFDAGFVIATPEDCPRGLSLRRIDHTQAVVVTVTGDYEGLVGGYDTIYRDGLALSQQPFCDTPAFLVYRSGGLVDRGQTPVTDIYLPIGD